jgi:hypothetical protein
MGSPTPTISLNICRPNSFVEEHEIVSDVVVVMF